VTLAQSAYHGGAITTPWSIHVSCGGPRVAAQKLEEVARHQEQVP
jgi:hypothetical protein